MTSTTATSSRPRPGYRANLMALLAAQKPQRGTAAYSRFVNRPAGRLVAAAAHVVGMKPNVATMISAAMSGTALVLLVVAEPTALVGLAVAALLAGGYVMDSVDGQLARLAGSGTLSGEWLDHMVDCVKTCSLHLAILVSWYRFPPVEDRWILLVPIGYEIVQMAMYFGLMSMPALRKRGGAATPAVSAGAEHPLRTWLILPDDYGVLCWVFLLLAWPLAFVAAYSMLFLCGVAILVLALRKWWRELRALDALAVGGAHHA